jgi:hypothetical protein
MVEGRIDVTGGRGRLRQLLDDFKETRIYWKLKAEAVDRILWRSCLGRAVHLADYMLMTSEQISV